MEKEESFSNYWVQYCETLFKLGYEEERSRELAMKDFENGIPVEDAVKYFLEDKHK